MSIPPSSAAAPSSSSSSQFTYQTTTNPLYFPLPFHLQRQAQTYAPLRSQFRSPQLQPLSIPPHWPPSPASILSLNTNSIFEEARQLFQSDAQIITPEALESVKAALASSEIEHKAETKKKAIPRKAAGQSWEDPTLVDWPENYFRLFCGDVGNEVNDDVLSKAFSRFPSFNMARVVGDKRTGKTKGLWVC